MKVIVAGGGSAGHVLPAIPVIEALVEAGDEVLFIGTRSGLEEDLLQGVNCAFSGISAGKLRRYFSWENLLDVFRTMLGIVQSLWLVIRYRPGAIFSKGGYVSFPVALAGWLCRVPIVAHESDITPGLANRLVLPLAKTLCTSFAVTEIAARGLKVVHTGTPLREAITGGNAAEGRSRLGLADDDPLIVVTGGSLGADGLNEVVRASLPRLIERGHVFHVCGPGKIAGVEQPRYTEAEYVNEGWGDILAAADVVISRAGANALFELVALEKKNLLIPLPRRASRGDQIDNAAYAEEQGWSLVIAEEELTPKRLDHGVEALLEHGEKWQEQLAGFQIPNSTNAIVTEIHDAAGKSP